MSEGANFKLIQDALKKLEHKSPIKTGNPDDYYVKLLIYKRRKVSFIMLLGFMFFMIVLTTFFQIHSQRPWILSFFPICTIGLSCLLHPTVEEWPYRPWQAAAQQVEKHSYDIM